MVCHSEFCVYIVKVIHPNAISVTNVVVVVLSVIVPILCACWGDGCLVFPWGLSSAPGCFYAMTKTQVQGRAKHTRCMHDENCSVA